MASKLANMVATPVKPPVKRGRGRPRKFHGSATMFHVYLPDDLKEAVERHAQNRPEMSGPSDAMRDLLRQGAERRGLVEPRK